jgi:hypothetical protein
MLDQQTSIGVYLKLNSCLCGNLCALLCTAVVSDAKTQRRAESQSLVTGIGSSVIVEPPRADPALVVVTVTGSSPAAANRV